MDQCEKNMIEAVSGGKNTILYDYRNKGSIMVRIPKFKISDVISGGPEVTHPGFFYKGKERECLYVSKYQNVVDGECSYSLPYKDPAVLYSFSQAKEFCENKGEGWHLMTNSEWSAVALWSLKNNTLPRGNNFQGGDYEMTHERGVLISLDAHTPEGEIGPPMRVATGSGPESWTHDHTGFGIYDMNGNVWEMLDGVKMVNGEIQLLEECSEGASWKSLGLEHPLISRSEEYSEENQLLFAHFKETGKDAEFSQKNSLQAMCLYPVDDVREDDAIWGIENGERFPIRGGYWVNREMAGVFSCGFYMQKDDSYFDVGFRACYFDESE